MRRAGHDEIVNTSIAIKALNAFRNKGIFGEMEI